MGVLLLAGSCQVVDEISKIINKQTMKKQATTTPKPAPIVEDLKQFKTVLKKILANDRKINNAFNELKTKRYSKLKNKKQIRDYRRFFRYQISLPLKRSISELSRFKTQDANLSKLHQNLLIAFKNQDSAYDDFANMLNAKQIRRRKEFMASVSNLAKEIRIARSKQVKILQQIALLNKQYGL